VASYIPQGPGDKQALLEGAGLQSIEEIYAAVPEAARLGRKLNLPGPMAEEELRRYFKALAGRNSAPSGLPSFLGMGVYDRVIPSAVGALASREEFFTSYTPYQPEISQGTLRMIFEFQSMVASLTGLDVANASMYDGASALAEAILMACKNQKKKKALLSEAVSSEAKAVCETYCAFFGIELDYLPSKGGHALAGCVTGEYGAVAAMSPNRYGVIEDLAAIAEASHQAGALMIAYCENPHALAVLKSPGAAGADIACGEMQGFGIPASYGGPSLGYMAAASTLMRKLPGRIVGETVDDKNNRAFVLTLQAREQHIRREKATSNICTNQSLNALRATVYMALLGAGGIAEAARAGMALARYILKELARVGIYALFEGANFVDEVAVGLPCPYEEAFEALLARGILGGSPLEGHPNAMVISVTEKRTKAEADALVDALGEVGK